MESRISIITLGVQDFERSFEFYHKGLGFPTNMTIADGIVFYLTAGTRLAIYPFEKLAEDILPDLQTAKSGFNGITLAHNAKNKADVDNILQLAQAAGGKILKKPQNAFWGGYHGYFADLDNYIWEIAYADFWKFNADGSLKI